MLLKTLKNEVQRDEVVIVEQRFELCLRAGMIKKNLNQMEDQKFCVMFGATFFLQRLKVFVFKIDSSNVNNKVRV